MISRSDRLVPHSEREGERGSVGVSNFLCIIILSQFKSYTVISVKVKVKSFIFTWELEEAFIFISGAFVFMFLE